MRGRKRGDPCHFLFRERLKAFNAKHKVITYSDTIVRPVSWDGGKDGIDIDGIPYYGSYEDEDEDTPGRQRDVNPYRN